MTNLPTTTAHPSETQSEFQLIAEGGGPEIMLFGLGLLVTLAIMGYFAFILTRKNKS